MLIDGQEVAGPAAFLPPERRGVGLMFQDYALFPHLTILANVTFGLRALPRADAEREARRMLGRVGLEALADEYPHALSGGEQQRVALARAIVPRPSVLLMDEPFSGLDRRLRESIRDETLAILRETRVTAIIVTHDPEEAMRLGDRIALMREGRIAQIGTAEDLYRRPIDLAAARFLSDVNTFEGRVTGGRAAVAVGDFPAPGFAEGSPVVVAVRPQAMRLASPAQGGAAGGLAGVVSARHFLGEVDQIEVTVDGLEAPLRVRMPGGHGWRTGAEVTVRADPAGTLLFAKPAL